MSNILQKEQEPEKAGAWMLTFADLLSLILTFFVMLYAMSAVVEPKWHKIKSSLTRRLNPDKEIHEIILTADKSIPKVETKQALNVTYLFSILQEKMSAEKALAVLKIEAKDDHLTITVPMSLFFKKEDARLTKNAQEIMALLEEIFHQMGNRVDVVSYADASEPTGQYASYWELSLARAESVAEGLRKFGYGYAIESSSALAPTTKKTQGPEKELYDGSAAVDIVIRSEKAALIKASGTP